MLAGGTLRLEHARERVLRLVRTREVAAWEIAYLGSCRLENAFGKVPYIISTDSISRLASVRFPTVPLKALSDQRMDQVSIIFSLKMD